MAEFPGGVEGALRAVVAASQQLWSSSTAASQELWSQIHTHLVARPGGAIAHHAGRLAAWWQRSVLEAMPTAFRGRYDACAGAVGACTGAVLSAGRPWHAIHAREPAIEAHRAAVCGEERREHAK